MATINIRVEDDLKNRSFAVLAKLGVTPSDLLRQTLQYVADQDKLPFKVMVLTDEDAHLVAIVKERLKHPRPIRVKLDEL